MNGMLFAVFCMSNKLDAFVKSRQSRHPGESRGPEVLVFLDSGFCRNDEKRRYWTFYECIKLH